MKKFFTSVFALALCCGGPAYADFEAVETVLGKLEDLQKEAQNVQEELKAVQAKINAVRQGEFGPLEDIKSNIPNVAKVDVKMIGPIADKVGDVKSLEGAVAENMMPQYTDKDQSQTYIDTKLRVDAIRRENLARMYAYALTLRTNMQKTRDEGASLDKPVTAEDSREILQSAATKEAMENARRFSHIWDMQASIDELALIEMSLRYADKDTKQDKNGAEGEK